MSILKRLLSRAVSWFTKKQQIGHHSESATSNSPTDTEIVNWLSSTKPPIPISREILLELFPIRNFGEELDVYVIERKAVSVGAESVLFRKGEPIESLLYLLEGTIRMEFGGGHTTEIHAHSIQARFPLGSGQSYNATAHAETDLQILVFSPEIMRRSISVDVLDKALIDINDPNVPSELRNNRMFEAFCQFYKGGEIKIPSLPDVAIKLRQAIHSQQDVSEVAKIVQIDPAIAGKLVKVANSPIYSYVQSKPVTNCQDAIQRLGFSATRNLVMSYSLCQIFQSKDPHILNLLQNEWKQSIYLAALCWVLADEEKAVNPEEAQLAGLIADIGVVPLLYCAETLPNWYWTTEELLSALPYVRSVVGTAVLRHWGFPEEMIMIPSIAEDWFHDEGPELQIGDIVTLAKLHALIGTKRAKAVPVISSLPSFSKLKHGELTPEFSLETLRRAKAKVLQYQNFLE